MNYDDLYVFIGEDPICKAGIRGAITPERYRMLIDRVIFNPPATIVLWKDGTKTVVRCGENDTYSKEHGLAMAICKKALGNKGNYNNVFKKWIKED